uniref:Uncharacterized protein n=1 Tax=Anguilla anguilla TaxID=7936 RepID=A0A0E9S3I3_ANGAN
MCRDTIFNTHIGLLHFSTLSRSSIFKGQHSQVIGYPLSPVCICN